MITDLNVGDTVLFYDCGEKVEGIVIEKEKNFYNSYVFTLLISNKNRMNIVAHQTSLRQLLIDGGELIENLHFFTLDSLTETLTSMSEEIEVLGTTSNVKDHITVSNFLFIKHKNQIYKLLILDLRERVNAELKYVFMVPITDKEYLEQIEKSGVYFWAIGEKGYAKALDLNDFEEFTGKALTSGFGVHGVRIANVGIYDMGNDNLRHSHGNGLIIN